MFMSFPTNFTPFNKSNGQYFQIEPSELYDISMFLQFVVCIECVILSCKFNSNRINSFYVAFTQREKLQNQAWVQVMQVQ